MKRFVHDRKTLLADSWREICASTAHRKALGILQTIYDTININVGDD